MGRGAYPAALQQKLEAASDMDQQLDTIEQIRAALEREKAAVGLLITTAEWVKAVKATQGIRLAKKDARLKTSTGSVLTFKHRPEDVGPGSPSTLSQLPRVAWRGRPVPRLLVMRGKASAFARCERVTRLTGRAQPAEG